MDPVTGSLLGGAIGGGLNLFSAQNASQTSLKSAREQMRFQERMSNTAYQRSASDLEKAGLNRIIALGNPASTPGGAGYSMPDAKLGSSALDGASAVAQVRNLTEQNKLIRAQARLTDAEADKAEITKAGYEMVGPLVDSIKEKVAGFNAKDAASWLGTPFKNLDNPLSKVNQNTSDFIDRMFAPYVSGWKNYNEAVVNTGKSISKSGFIDRMISPYVSGWKRYNDAVVNTLPKITVKPKIKTRGSRK